MFLIFNPIYRVRIRGSANGERGIQRRASGAKYSNNSSFFSGIDK
jgi:hypothetical protein